MIKAIFFDIDGTLVSFNTHLIPTSTIEAVHLVREMGVKVFIATGRPFPLIDRSAFASDDDCFCKNLGELEYDGIVSSNGAAGVLRDGTTIFREGIDRSVIHRIIENQRVHPMPIVFATNDEVFCVDWLEQGDNAQQVWDLLNNPMPPIRPIEDALSMDIVQVIPFFTIEEAPRILSEVLKGCSAFRWHPLFADCIREGNDKGTAIEHVCRYFGIDVSETMAFGDGGNDIEMLVRAGVGVAMGNANDDVKAYADYVTAHIDDDGVAKALEKFVLRA